MIVDGRINLTKLFVGSEGTLGIITKAKMKIKEKPKYTLLATAMFENLETAGKATEHIVEYEPMAIELLGAKLIQMARKRYPKLKEKLPERLNTLLLVELEGNRIELLREKASKLEHMLLNKTKLAFDFQYAEDEEEKRNLWEARKSAVPLLYKIKGDRKIIALIEDAVVPIENLAKYIKELEAYTANLGVDLIVYGHAGKGLLHNRPLLDMKDSEDIVKMEKIADKSYELVQKHGGTVSGEHSDGRVRCRYIKLQYGEALYDVFQEVKKIFDPRKGFNPACKNSEKPSLLTSNLRFGKNYSPIVPSTKLMWNEGEFEETIENCIGCGKCATPSLDLVMCPAFKGKNEEYVLPRAKTNIMRGYIEGNFSLEELMEHELFEKMIFNCTGCQQCEVECPSEVKTAKLMGEMKMQYIDFINPKFSKFVPRSINPIKEIKRYSKIIHQTHICLTNSLFANFDRLGKIASFFDPLSNWMSRFIGTRIVMDLALGIKYKRKMPAFHRQTFRKWWKDKKDQMSFSPSINSNKKVIYFHGCSTNYIYPEVGKATIEVLQKLGVEVQVPPQKCCGSPAFSLGVKKVIDANIDYNTNEFNKWIKKGYDIVTSCSSCALALSKEYLDVSRDPKVLSVANNVYLITEYINKILEENDNLNITFAQIDGNLLYHTPCHMRASKTNKNSSLDLLKHIPGLGVKKTKDTCCGICGFWGMKRENYKASIEIGTPLFKSIKENDERIIVTDCPTCKIQIEEIMKKDVKHPISIINTSLQELSN